MLRWPKQPKQFNCAPLMVKALLAGLVIILITTLVGVIFPPLIGISFAHAASYDEAHSRQINQEGGPPALQATATLTPTLPAVITPTVTPTATPTPVPANDTVVKIEPQRYQTPLCSTEVRTVVAIQNVANLSAVSLEVRYNPQMILVLDADEQRSGVQIRPDDTFLSNPSFVVQNEVDTTRGLITFAATLLGEQTINGAANLIIIDWRPQAAGVSQVSLNKVELAGAGGGVIPHTVVNGELDITAGCRNVSGIVILQGKNNASGVLISNVNGETVQTNAAGHFTIAGGNPIKISFPGYLSAEANPPDTTEDTDLGKIILLAGDLKQDDIIDIFDLVQIANNLYTDDADTDLNGDGRVDVLDLALVANNYRKQGPLIEWE